MNRIFIFFGQRHYQILFAAILPIWIITILGWKGSLDLQMHDTYFVVSVFSLAHLFTFVLGLLGIFYFLLRKQRLTSWLTFIHVLISVICLLYLQIACAFFSPYLPFEMIDMRIFQSAIAFAFFIFCLSQVVFVTNIGMALKNRS